MNLSDWKNFMKKILGKRKVFTPNTSPKNPTPRFFEGDYRLLVDCTVGTFELFGNALCYHDVEPPVYVLLSAGKAITIPYERVVFIENRGEKNESSSGKEKRLP